jgi:hypothetical protein
MTDAQQLFADNIANMLGRASNPDERRSIMYAVQRFEGAQWWPDMFDEAMKEFPSIVLVDSYIPADDVSLTDVREMLERYIEIIEEKTGAPAIPNEVFSKRAAAWYIYRKLTKQGKKVTHRQIDFQLRDKGYLKGQTVGNTMLLTRQQLDEYVDNFDKLPKRGRPAAERVEN